MKVVVSYDNSIKMILVIRPVNLLFKNLLFDVELVLIFLRHLIQCFFFNILIEVAAH